MRVLIGVCGLVLMYLAVTGKASQLVTAARAPAATPKRTTA